MYLLGVGLVMQCCHSTEHARVVLIYYRHDCDMPIWTVEEPKFLECRYKHGLNK